MKKNIMQRVKTYWTRRGKPRVISGTRADIHGIILSYILGHTC